MLAPSKRRASLYTLPFVVLIGFLSVVGLAAWQRSEAIADLADRVARGEKEEATAAVRQLAAIPKPPLAILVEASASDERATAEAAQVAINRMLGQWQKQIDKKKSVSSVSKQVTELAAALAAERQNFPSSDYPWLAGATRKIMRIADKCPAKKTPLVALHCDEVFVVVEHNAAAAKVAGSTAEVDSAAKQTKVAADKGIVRSEPQQAMLEREFLAYPMPSVSNDLWPSVELPTNKSSLPPVPKQQESSSPLGGIHPIHAGHDQLMPTSESIPMGQQWSPADGAVRPEWSLPIFRIMPQPPVDSVVDLEPPSGAAAVHPPTNDASASSAAETRALIAEWNDASELQRPAIEENLAERGFRRMSSRIIKQYLSSDLRERLRVVDSVLTEPDVDPRPWLLLLAEDDDADVRLTAVSVMATSNDPRLIEAAWEAAIGDRDPRIAGLAERLRARRQ